jgi:hypothetical protein
MKLEDVVQAIGNANIRSEADPCRLRTWISALFTDDYPTQEQQRLADDWADKALLVIARTAVEAMRDPDKAMVDAWRKGHADEYFAIGRAASAWVDGIDAILRENSDG